MTFQAQPEKQHDEAPRLSLPLLIRDVAVVLTAGALCLVLASGLSDLGRGKTELSQLITRQSATLKTTSNAESQLESVARGLQQLASAGNPNAQKIVAVLQANGIHIKP